MRIGLETEVEKKINGKKLIIFDFDGVIANSPPKRYDLIKKVGLFVVGLRYFGMMKNITDPAIEKIMNRRFGNIEPISEVYDFIKLSNMRKSIYSINSHRIINLFLKKYNIKDKFELVFGIEDVKMPKPFPEGINKILRELDLSRKDALFIGDSWTDGISSLLARVDFINIKDFLKYCDNFLKDEKKD